MQIVGKCPPEPDELAQVSEMGFEGVELYLTTDHLDAFDESIRACRASSVDIVSVHTPHVTREDFDYIQRANDLAVEFDAYLVVHSMGFHLTNLNVMDDTVDFTANHGFESHPGNNLYFIENTVFAAGREFVLDTAHFYGSEEAYLEGMEYLFEEHGDSISLVHLCDGLRKKDGLAFGEGTMDIESVCECIKQHFDGIVVIEVMPEHQKAGWEFFESV